MKPLIPVIIINYQQPKNVLACLQSIWDQDDCEQLKPIIVDEQTDSPLEQALTQKFGQWCDYLPLPENLGFTGANNAGLRLAARKYQPQTVIVLNDDTTIGPKALTQLAYHLHRRGRRGAVVPKIYFSPGREFHPGYKRSEIGRVIWYAGGEIDWTEVVGFHRGVDEVDRGQFETAEPTEFATGCCVAFNMQALQEVGYFDDDYFLYLEDLDLSQRLRQAGWSLWYEPEPVIWHKNAGSTGGSGSALHVYYQTRNRYLFGFRYAPWRTKLFLLKHLLLQYRSGTGPIRQAIQDFILERYGQRFNVH